jgi:class 3 adenylate cyclase
VTDDAHGKKLGEPEIRAFLIADVRGYTTFTQAHGDEAAARLLEVRRHRPGGHLGGRRNAGRASR